MCRCIGFSLLVNDWCPGSRPPSNTGLGLGAGYWLKERRGPHRSDYGIFDPGVCVGRARADYFCIRSEVKAVLAFRLR